MEYEFLVLGLTAKALVVAIGLLVIVPSAVLVVLGARLALNTQGIATKLSETYRARRRKNPFSLTVPLFTNQYWVRLGGLTGALCGTVFAAGTAVVVAYLLLR